MTQSVELDIQLRSFENALGIARTEGASYLLGRTLVVDAFAVGTSKVTMDTHGVWMSHTLPEEDETEFRLHGIKWNIDGPRGELGVPTLIDIDSSKPNVTIMGSSDAAEIDAGGVLTLVSDNLIQIDPDSLPAYWPNRLGAHTPNTQTRY